MKINKNILVGMYEVALEAKFESQSFCRILKVPVAVMNERIRDTLGLSMETFLKQRIIHELRNRIFGEKDISDKVAYEQLLMNLGTSIG